jgi:hypothetical protein
MMEREEMIPGVKQVETHLLHLVDGRAQPAVLAVLADEAEPRSGSAGDVPSGFLCPTEK